MGTPAAFERLMENVGLFIAHACRKNNAEAGCKSKEHAFGSHGI